MRRILMAAGLALAAMAATPAGATSQSFPKAEALDQLSADYVRHYREHRMWEIQRNMERQERWERRGYGRGHGYSYGHRYGGPPPHARAYGYRRHQYDRY